MGARREPLRRDNSTRRAATALAVAVLVLLPAAIAQPRPADAVVPGENGRIAFASDRTGSWQIFTMDPDGSDQRNITNDPAAHSRNPAWSPDGTKIAFSRGSGAQTEIYVINADGTNRTQITDNSRTDWYPSWSPDGTKIAFASLEDGPDQWEIYVINADGTNPSRLTLQPGQDTEPAWSPDGTKIAFSSDRDGDSEIYVMSAAGTSPIQLTDNAVDDVEPGWSPGGTRITFTSNRDSGLEIYRMNADGTSPFRLTTDNESSRDAARSPEGNQITFSRQTTPLDVDIYLMNADRTGLANLTNRDDQNDDPDWGVACSHWFTDVPPWVTAAADWAACNGHMSGYGSRFRPDHDMTRAEIARLFYRVNSSPDVSGLPPHGFPDVPAWVDDAVRWLKANDYITGYPDGTFRPNQTVTRAQATRMHYRVNGSPPGSPPHPFTDVPAWIDAAVNWTTDPTNTPPYATGYPDGTFRPDHSISRAQNTRMTCRILGTAPC